MNLEPFEKIINEAWENKNQINKNSDKNILDAISETINLLDSGKLRVAEKKNNEWLVNQWAKKAILLSFRVNEMETISGPYATWFDKVKGKTSDWTKDQLLKSGFRSVPNGVIRKGAYIAKNVVLMPCFVNLGAYVGQGDALTAEAVAAKWDEITDKKVQTHFNAGGEHGQNIFRLLAEGKKG